MRIDRLVGILSILLQKEKVTAPELAEHFDVNRRTINRDIEELCKAGIPIVTAKRVFYEKKYAGELRLYPMAQVLFGLHREGYLDSNYP